jgi:phage shock protein PspC (stress-responsive transcriptional regulator)
MDDPSAEAPGAGDDPGATTGAAGSPGDTGHPGGATTGTAGSPADTGHPGGGATGDTGGPGGPGGSGAGSTDVGSGSGRMRPDRLYREPEDKALAGVCGGVADYVGIDPTVVRIGLTVLFVVSWPTAVIAYVVAVLAVPERPATTPRVRAPMMPIGDVPHGWLLVIAAATAVLLAASDRWWWSGDVPLVAPALIAVGVWMLLRNREARDRSDDHENNPLRYVATPGSQTPSSGPSGENYLALGVDSPTFEDEATSETDPGVDRDDAVTPTSSPPAHEGAGPPGGLPPLTPPEWSGPGAAGPAAVPDRSGWSGVTHRVVALLLVGSGIAWLVDIVDLVEVDLRDVLAIGLVVIGGGLVAAAWQGGAGPLIPLGVAVMLALMTAEVVDVPLGAGVGERTVEIDRRSELGERYELLMGELIVDMRDVPATARTAELSARVGVGGLQVRVPRDATVEVRSEATLGGLTGELSPGGDDDAGFLVEDTTVLRGAEGGPRLDLDLSVGLGEIEVIRG